MGLRLFMKNSEILRRIFWITLFAIAMGYFESAVVIYLRQIYYPGGFAFPLKEMQTRYILTEMFREAATLAMIVSVGILSARSSAGKFGIFLYVFGIWDIFYYVFLKVILDWPASLLTWDILFLLPSVWTGPVLAPCLNAGSMILIGIAIFVKEQKGGVAGLKKMEFILLFMGSLIILYTYMEDYLNFLLQKFSPVFLLENTGSEELRRYSATYVPESFPWIVFILGQCLILMAIIFYLRRMNKN